jgi:hypothetical protein
MSPMLWLIAFAAGAIVLETLSSLDRITWRTNHGIRLAMLGLSMSSFYALLETFYTQSVPEQGLSFVLISVSTMLAVDRRRSPWRP